MVLLGGKHATIVFEYELTISPGGTYHLLISTNISVKWMSGSKSASQITSERKKEFTSLPQTRDVQWRRLTPVDFDWPLKVPNASVNNEHFVVLHVHIHISGKHTEARKLQALGALREANSARHDPSYDAKGQTSLVMGFRAFKF